MPEKTARILEQEDDLYALARTYCRHRDFLYIGRKWSMPVALEGALKVKEVAYVHAEGYSAGEMKHGPLAMISPDFPTVAVIPKDALHGKTLSNMEEIRARGGPLIAIATEGDSDVRALTSDVFEIPSVADETLSPILSVIPLQLFAYHVARELGFDMDKPRNLAKSVTVE